MQALTGRFGDHHAELAAILLAQTGSLIVQIETLTARIEAVVSEIPAAQGVNEDGTTGPHAGRGPDAPVLPAIDRLQEIPGISRNAAQVIIAEAGLDMSRFPTRRIWCPGHGCARGSCSPGSGNGPAAPRRATRTSRASSVMPLQPQGRRTRSRVSGTGGWPTAVASSRPWPLSPRPLLVIVWHLLAARAARYRDLGMDYYISRLDTGRRARNYVRQLEALGYTVTLTEAA